MTFGFHGPHLEQKPYNLLNNLYLSTPAASTMDSAAQRTLATYELLESILCYIPANYLFRAL